MWLQPPRLQKEPRQRTAGTQLETTSIATPAQDSNGAEYQRAVRPAKAEAVRHHRAQRCVGGLAQHRETFGARVEFGDVGRAGHEAAAQHQQAVDRLVHAGRAERVARQRLGGRQRWHLRSEEHTSELQSLMRNSYAVFCSKKKKQLINAHIVIFLLCVNKHSFFSSNQEYNNYITLC